MADTHWWQHAVLYELLVPSFQDTDGDGWGDLPGVIQRLDYLSELGVGAVWLSPFYRSAMYDIGYDVIDHTEVDRRFGTLEDFDRLIRAAHARDLRVVIDYVPNHTSRRHPWFEQSRRGRESPRRDWYLWRDPAPDGGPPNNWINRFGRSAWTFDPATEQYYFGTFTPEQPDLNWRNPEVQEAMFDVLRFWLARGADGVRVDALPHLIKDAWLRDNPPDPSYTDDQEPLNRLQQTYSQNQPELIGLIGQLRSVIDEYPERVLIAEAYQSPEQIAAYQRAGIHLSLSTSMLQVDFGALSLRQMIDTVEAVTPPGAWPGRATGNHDIARLIERVGPDNARLTALLHATVRGTPAIYYGDELGLAQIEVPQAKMQDPSGREDPRYCRDCHRVPMPWDRQPGAGFSAGEPWLPIDAATEARNVADQLADPQSLLQFYRRILRLRAGESELQTGDYAPIDTQPPILAFRRGDPERGLLIALNISDDPATLPVGGRVLFSTSGDRDAGADSSPMELGAREGVIVRLVPDAAPHSETDTLETAGG